MKAIVLSFDKQHAFCELTYNMYMNLWSDCPFDFRIPWNAHKPLSLAGKSNIELIQCGKSIYSTMKALLTDIHDEDWVYWCIDDRFPVWVNPQKMNDLYQNLNQFAKFDFVKPFTHRHINSSTSDSILGDFVEQNIEQQFGFYMHHFCKAKILKAVFLSGDYLTIDDYHRKFICYSKFETAHTIKKYKGAVINFHKNDLIKLKEPCVDGKITEDGVDFLKKLNINHDLS